MTDYNEPSELLGEFLKASDPTDSPVAKKLHRASENDRLMEQVTGGGGFVHRLQEGDFLKAWKKADYQNRKVMRRILERC